MQPRNPLINLPLHLRNLLGQSGGFVADGGEEARVGRAVPAGALGEFVRRQRPRLLEFMGRMPMPQRNCSAC